MNEQTRRTFIRAGLIPGTSVLAGARLFGTAEGKASNDSKGKEEEVSPAEDSEFRKIVSRHEYDSSGEGSEKKEHELLGEDGFEKMIDKVGGIEKKLGIDELSQFTPKI